MQNIQAPTSEASSIKRMYAGTGSLNSGFVFKIPVYQNMPGEKAIKSISLDKTSLHLYRPDAIENIPESGFSATATLSVKIEPADTTDDKTITWTSSNPNIVSVKPDQTTHRSGCHSPWRRRSHHHCAVSKRQDCALQGNRRSTFVQFSTQKLKFRHRHIRRNTIHRSEPDSDRRLSAKRYNRWCPYHMVQLKSLGSKRKRRKSHSTDSRDYHHHRGPESVFSQLRHSCRRKQCDFYVRWLHTCIKK